MSLDISLKYRIDGNEIYVFDNNITHNLGKMADGAGIYYALWRPEEIKCKTAKDIIPILESGLKKLKKSQTKKIIMILSIYVLKITILV